MMPDPATNSKLSKSAILLTAASEIASINKIRAERHLNIQELKRRLKQLQEEVQGIQGQLPSSSLLSCSRSSLGCIEKPIFDQNIKQLIASDFQHDVRYNWKYYFYVQTFLKPHVKGFWQNVDAGNQERLEYTVKEWITKKMVPAYLHKQLMEKVLSLCCWFRSKFSNFNFSFFS